MNIKVTMGFDAETMEKAKSYAKSRADSKSKK
jgi:hypothetical protein